MKNIGDIYDLRIKYEHLKGRSVEVKIAEVKIKEFSLRDSDAREEKLMLRFARGDEWKSPDRWAKVTDGSADDLEYALGSDPSGGVGCYVILTPVPIGSGGYVRIMPAEPGTEPEKT